LENKQEWKKEQDKDKGNFIYVYNEIEGVA
jgi:hypothetical protein